MDLDIRAPGWIGTLSFNQSLYTRQHRSSTGGHGQWCGLDIFLAKIWPTDRPTVRRTGRWKDLRTDTVTYRVACSRLKYKNVSQAEINIMSLCPDPPLLTVGLTDRLTHFYLFNKNWWRGPVGPMGWFDIIIIPDIVIWREKRYPWWFTSLQNNANSCFNDKTHSYLKTLKRTRPSERNFLCAFENKSSFLLCHRKWLREVLVHSRFDIFFSLLLFSQISVQWKTEKKKLR